MTLLGKSLSSLDAWKYLGNIHNYKLCTAASAGALPGLAGSSRTWGSSLAHSDVTRPWPSNPYFEDEHTIYVS